ncbi:MAG: PIG-L family deacetylase, partial [Deltaproteobacteria bacterium]|nr:PIG-L family deacetylase [Deltaproteobacteria bacterium]
MITSAAVLYLTAHPDDEDAVTLTGLAAAGCRVGLFCLTRGEGGDNQVGSERAELLGARRTAELSGACEHYGVSWLGFSRAYDYGFSRHVDEARRLWDVGQLAEDLSTAIDSFRPDVLVSRFAGLPIDGHAHHQLCGELAVKVANERDLALWVGDLEHPASQSLIGDVASEVRERARAGYLCHRSQRADALWDAFASEPVRYRQVRSGAQGQASPQPRPTPLDGPVALPVARQSPGMYRWRQPRLATCAWMSADPRAPVVQAMPRALLRRPSASQAASRTVRTVERDGRPAVWAHDFGIEVHEPARQVITVATVEPVAEAVGYVPGYGADIEPALDDLCASWTRF